MGSKVAPCGQRPGLHNIQQRVRELGGHVDILERCLCEDCGSRSIPAWFARTTGRRAQAAAESGETRKFDYVCDSC